MLQFQNKASVTLICGRSGSGKTTFAFRYLANAPAACRFIFDPRGEAAARFNLAAAGTATELESDALGGWCIFDPHGMFPADMTTAFRYFCEWVFTVAGRSHGRKIVLIDEVWKYCTPQSIPQELAMCIQEGRKYGLEMLFLTQRPNRLNEAITNEASELVLFCLQGENALKSVDNLATEPTGAQALALGEFKSYNLDTGGTLVGRVF
jgi:hypothetical protein